MSKKFFYISLTLLLMACGGKKSDPAPPANPAAAYLLTPQQNSLCITGMIISDSLSTVSFNWQASANTNSYDIVLKNLLTSTIITESTSATQLDITLSRNTPYSWYIISRSTSVNVTAESDTWKFYNSGAGVVTYAPFPAEITAPTSGENVNAVSGKINLTWVGNAVDRKTILNYDIYFGTTTSPALLKGATTDSFMDGVSVSSGTSYYWKVITRDISGDTSDSGLYQFTVN